MLIKDDFRIEAYVQHTKVDTRDLLHGFSRTVTRYSAIDNVLDRLRNTPVNVGVELKYLGSKVLELTNELESTNVRHRQITFTGKKLMALSRGKIKLPPINLYEISLNTIMPSLNLEIGNVALRLSWKHSSKFTALLVTTLKTWIELIVVCAIAFLRHP